jgi:hypothetical protein
MSGPNRQQHDAHIENSWENETDDCPGIAVTLCRKPHAQHPAQRAQQMRFHTHQPPLVRTQRQCRLQEDIRLGQLVHRYGTASWPDIAAEMPGRTSKSCSLR